MICSDMITVLERLAPLSCACDWDNPGLLAGRSGKEVHRVVVAVDASDEVMELAVKERADLLLTHHPLIHRPLKKINDLDVVSARIVKLIQHDIACYAMHTNFDSAPGCMADVAAGRLKLLHTAPLELMGVTPHGVPYGIGKVGELPEAMSLSRLAVLTKQVFGLPFAVVYGLEEITEPIRRIAVCPGSGKRMLPYVKAGKAQVLITGDMGHHDSIDAVAEGVAVIDGGHYGLEHLFMDVIETYILEQLGEELQVIKAPVKFPGSIL